MQLDITVHRGERDRPVIIFIHGLGMSKDIWVDPLNTKVFARNIPLKVFAAKRPRASTLLKGRRITLGNLPRDIKNVWAVLRDEGFNLICWSQRRPVGPISVAVDELSWIMKKAERLFPKGQFVLIGHSRGGLVARKFMEKRQRRVKALITISTPHKGSSLAKLGRYLLPFSSVLKGILPRHAHGIVAETIKNIITLLEGNAWRELLPEADFFKDLKDSRQSGVQYLSLGGTQPRLFTVYVWRKSGEKAYPKPLLSFPDSLVKILPSSLAANELVPGKGDGLVTAESSLLPWASMHHNLPVNHVSILWNKRAINYIVELLNILCS
jgi:pimeloyl-ACP methyl ester carboxylesterase